MKTCMSCHARVPALVEGTRHCIACDSRLDSPDYQAAWRAGYTAGIAAGRKSMTRTVCCDLAAVS